jgi:hypothetical protein
MAMSAIPRLFSAQTTTWQHLGQNGQQGMPLLFLPEQTPILGS